MALRSLIPNTKVSSISSTCSAAKITKLGCKSAFSTLSKIVFDEYQKGFRFKSHEHMMSIVSMCKLTKRKTEVPCEDATREKKAKVVSYKQLHNIGDTVYTCKNKDERHDDWVTGKIVNWKKVGETNQYGECRTYDVDFEDGTKVKEMVDYFVKSFEDYQWSIRLEPIGVEHIFGNRKEHDDYLCFRGWFRVGNNIFSSFCKAMRSYNDTVVTRKQGNSTVEDLTLPHKWDFGTVGACPCHFDSSKHKPALKFPPLLQPTSQLRTTIPPSPSPCALSPVATTPPLFMATGNSSWAKCKLVLEQAHARLYDKFNLDSPTFTGQQIDPKTQNKVFSTALQAFSHHHILFNLPTSLSTRATVLLHTIACCNLSLKQRTSATNI